MSKQQTTTDELPRNFLACCCRVRRGDDRRNDCDGNAMNGSLELADHQLREIQAAAKTLLPRHRELARPDESPKAVIN